MQTESGTQFEDYAIDQAEGAAGERGSAISRRRLLQTAAAVTGGFAVSRLVAPLPAFAASGEETADDQTILRFSTMAGIQPPFIGAAGASIGRGIQGGGAPWVVSVATGSLSVDGQLKVHIRGLVLDPAAVPAPAGGTNPVPGFMAIVSGFSTASSNPIELVTALFPASTTGDADIAATFTLPHPFFAPIIFVTSPPLGTPAAPRWLAVAGNK